jgi:hypothetical protein
MIPTLAEELERSGHAELLQNMTGCLGPTSGIDGGQPVAQISVSVFIDQGDCKLRIYALILLSLQQDLDAKVTLGENQSPCRDRQKPSEHTEPHCCESEQNTLCVPPLAQDRPSVSIFLLKKKKAADVRGLA